MVLTCGVHCGESCAACKERTEATGVAKIRARNEALDVRVYALSAFVNLNANLDQLAKSLKAKASMNAKLKPRKLTRSKPSRTGRRAAKASSTVGRPDELKILNLTYKVIFSSQEEMIVSGAMGFCSVDAQLIVVAEDQANDAMQDTFLHEVIHALTAAFDLKDKDKEESFVRRLATGICTVWNDNPKAFKWWRELV